jgi:Tol biopolymer transport system component
MGEVWRATDTRLDRSVAVKILPAEFAQNAQLRIRFEREAKTISQLEHPNICRLYDVGESDGADSSSPTSYLVMELLEGESLADRLARGALPLHEVLKYGSQIAEALDRAHRAGVVHRDLKPGNVMITKSGAKLLDFGLAKSAVVTGAPSPSPASLDGATQHRPLTEQGTIIGTFQYMSPEQLEGEEADVRTDIFALGAVLYEMATGTRAFEGKTRTSLIAAIVKEHPRPISQIQPLTPPALEHLIQRCLAKDPDDRWQNARDVAEELRWIGEAGSQAGVAGPVVQRRKSRERLAWGLAALALVLAIVAGLAAWRIARQRQAPQVMRFSAPNTVSAAPTGVYGVIAISPDGSQIVYGATSGNSRMLYRRAIDQFEPKAIPGTEGAVQPFFSPDGTWIAFFARHKLMKVALSGGQPVVIAQASQARGGDWLDDDTLVYCPFYYGGIERVAASGAGAPRAVSTVNRAAGERSHRWPHGLPGGKAILYSIGYGGTWDDAKVVAQRLDTGERKVVINGGCDARYVPTGHLVYVRGNSLYAVGFDAEKLEAHGQPVEVATGIANHSAGGGEFAFSRNGLLVYFSPGVGADEGGKIVMLGAHGEKSDGLLPPFPMVGPRFSPDGRTLIGQRGWDVWSFDLLRGTSTRISSGSVRTIFPMWSADGSRVFYGSERSGPWQIYSRAADGSDEERRISKDDESIAPSGISPDGQSLAALIYRKETGADLAVIPIAEGRARFLVQSEADETQGTFSPDSKWIAYTSDESGRDEVYVRPAGGMSGRWQVSTEGGNNPRWLRPDEIVYQTGSGLMRVEVKSAPSFAASPPKIMLERSFADYDLARDGRILIVEGPDTSKSTGQLNVVVNWFEEVRARSH